MSIDSALKNEGISILGKLNKEEVNKIAANISEKISTAFPEHHLDQDNLYHSIAELDMYIAQMPDDMAVAKYFYKNNSIYFSKDIDLEDLNTLAIHECIHFIQEVKSKSGKLIRLGLYNKKVLSEEGMAINEAAVQHMASIASNTPMDSVKYYNMEFSTESPNFYPLQTALLNEMMYFTGTYPLYHSTLYSNDIFKNTFIAKTSPKTYSEISQNFDLIMQYETMLSEESAKYITCSEKKQRVISDRLQKIKQIIFEKTLETQNIIIYNCFKNELKQVRSLSDVDSFKIRLYNFRHILIDTQNYNYFNDFSTDMLSQLEEKREFILKYGNILTLDPVTHELTNIKNINYSIQFFIKVFDKIKLLTEETFRQKDY